MHALNPLTWFRWLGEFIRCWFLGIPWRDAPKAIPAVILSMVLFTTAFIAFSGGAQQPLARWRNRLLDRQLRVSLEREDFPTAEIVIRRQLEADPKNVELIHRFALVREAQSFEEEAKVVMRQLLTRRHLPAAKWLLENQIIGKKLTDFSPAELDEVGRVLQLITEREGKNFGAKRMYAEYLIFEQRLSSAIPIVLELSEVEPMRGLQAAALARQLNEFDAAEQYASAALERVQELHKDDPTNSQIAMSIARNQIFLERHSDAIRTLKGSIDVAKTQEERRMLTQALGDAIVAYVNYIEKSPTNTVQERLRVLSMLDAAVKIAPNNPRVVTMVADHVLASLNEENEQIATVRAALISGSPAGIAHFIKGTAALMKEDLAMAELHLEQAAEQMPRSGAIMNNLSVALAMKEQPDYQKALQVANAAIDNVPIPTPHFFETRGQILFRMGRFREAISDLERALPAPDLKRKAHQMLADCYDKVGDTDLAQGHRNAAEKMKDAEQSDADVLETQPKDGSKSD